MLIKKIQGMDHRGVSLAESYSFLEYTIVLLVLKAMFEVRRSMFSILESRILECVCCFCCNAD